jgi:hypothetical protein
MAAAMRFLRGEREGVEPVWRFGEAKAAVAGEASGGAGGLKLTALETSAEAAAGMRFGRGRTTYYVRAQLDPLDGMVGTSQARVRGDGPPAREAVVELTRDGGGVREVAFRNVERGARAGEVVETVARLDLLDPAHRAAAEPLLALRLPWPPAAVRELGVLARRAVREGVVERAVYDVRDESTAVEMSVKAGLALGLDGREVDVERRLVAASAWTNGSRERERADCGVTAAGRERTS